MKDPLLDKLVESKDISSYTFEETDDANTYGDDVCYERLTIIFPSGKTISIFPSVGQKLFICEKS